MEKRQPLIDDPEYVQGQIAALIALIVSAARQLDREEFVAAAVERLEFVKTAMLDSQATDVRILGVEHVENTIRRLAD